MDAGTMQMLKQMLGGRDPSTLSGDEWNQYIGMIIGNNQLGGNKAVPGDDPRMMGPTMPDPSEKLRQRNASAWNYEPQNEDMPLWELQRNIERGL